MIFLLHHPPEDHLQGTLTSDGWTKVPGGNSSMWEWWGLGRSHFWGDFVDSMLPLSSLIWCNTYGDIFGSRNYTHRLWKLYETNIQFAPENRPKRSYSKHPLWGAMSCSFQGGPPTFSIKYKKSIPFSDPKKGEPHQTEVIILPHRAMHYRWET